MLEKIIFFNKLYIISIYHSLIMLFSIPFELYIANSIASLTNKALILKLNEVFCDSIRILIFTILFYTINSALNYFYRNKKSKQIHLCKMEFYRHYMNQSISTLYKLENGESIEKINDDFKTIVNKYIDTYPKVFINTFKFIIYLSLLIFKSSYIGIALLVISSLQIIPPFIIKRFMQQNYINCRSIEAKITNYVIAGYEGFNTIKLFFLKSWYLDKLKIMHKEYKKIGKATEMTATAEEMMINTVDNVLQYGTYIIIGIIILKTNVNYSIGIIAITLSKSFYNAIKTIVSTLPEFAVIKIAEGRLGELYEGDYTVKKFSSENDLIEFCNITYKYGEKVVLNQITGSFHTCGITIIVGKNGSGKSTFMKIVTGIIQVETGNIKLFGENLHYANESFLEMFFYMDQWDLYLNLTAFEIFQLNGGEIRNKCMKNALEFGLSKQLITESKVKDLSGGERKKVYLSLAFAKDVKLLMLDEPTNNLDDAGKKALNKLIGEREGDIIIISHEEDMVELADRILRVDGGKIYEYKKEDFPGMFKSDVQCFDTKYSI